MGGHVRRLGRQEAVTVGRLLVPVAAMALVAAACPAAGASGRSSVAVGSAARVLAIAEAALGRDDRAAAEAAFRAVLADPDPAMRAEAGFRLARLIARDGRRTEAAVLLRQVLDQAPGAVPVRLELAGLLHQMGRPESALRELRALRTAELPANVARFVDRMSLALQAGKPFGVQLELALAPDSNINRATRSDTLGTVLGDFQVGEESQARSGVGAAVRGLAFARLPLAGDVDLAGRLVADANLYRDKDFNDMSVELSAGPEVRFGRTRATAELGIGQQWFGMQPYQRSLRLSAGLSRPLDAVSQLRLDATARWSDNRVNDLQDGRGLALRARYERALSQRLWLTASLAGERYLADDPAYSTRSWTAGLAAYRDIGRMTLSLGADIGGLQADDRLAILPEARADRLTRIHAGAVLRQLSVGGFAPMARVVVERNRSTVEFHDYRRTRTEFGITRAF